MLNFARRTRRGLDLVLSTACALMMAALVACVTWQVLSRYVLARPSTLTDEASRFLLIWLVLAAAALCTGAKRHLAIDLIVGVLGARGRRWLELYIDVAMTGFAFWVMLIGGLRMMSTAAGVGELSPAMQLQMSYVYAILPVSGAAILAYCLLSIAETLAGATPGSAAAAGQGE
ncbi:TRAP transporter small permease [Poseidonocella sp. HB161398]|uniref:TRAP transporter small permease n=1 Tax=Poseidonocella sp. HB161398 TaxID=2320855 RepID=UPI0011081AE9|nr:TRAP transporter small permease [Poseidonocella sp. HB161398]